MEVGEHRFEQIGSYCAALAIMIWWSNNGVMYVQTGNVCSSMISWTRASLSEGLVGDALNGGRKSVRTVMETI